MITMDDFFIDALRNARVIAVVGASDKPHRPSHRTARYLKEAGYRVIPVNPHCERVMDDPCYPDLLSIPKEEHIDIIDIFRNAAHTAEVVRQAIERMKETGEHPIIWTQIGASSEEAQELARAAGLPYVSNRCLMIEHAHRIGPPD